MIRLLLMGFFIAMVSMACAEKKFGTLDSNLGLARSGSSVSDDVSQAGSDDSEGGLGAECTLESELKACHKYSGRDVFEDSADPDQYRDLLPLLSRAGVGIDAFLIVLNAVRADDGENLNRKVSVTLNAVDSVTDSMDGANVDDSSGEAEEDLCVSLRALRAFQSLGA